MRDLIFRSVSDCLCGPPRNRLSPLKWECLRVSASHILLRCSRISQIRAASSSFCLISILSCKLWEEIRQNKVLLAKIFPHGHGLNPWTPTKSRILFLLVTSHTIDPHKGLRVRLVSGHHVLQFNIAHIFCLPLSLPVSLLSPPM